VKCCVAWSQNRLNACIWSLLLAAFLCTLVLFTCKFQSVRKNEWIPQKELVDVHGISGGEIIMNVAKNSVTNSTRDKENTPAYQVRVQAIHMTHMRNIFLKEWVIRFLQNADHTFLHSVSRNERNKLVQSRFFSENWSALIFMLKVGINWPEITHIHPCFTICHRTYSCVFP
jgi:hypothetical protein